MAGAGGSRLHKAASATPRRSKRQRTGLREEDGVLDVFQDMLSDATPSKTASLNEDSKPLKKRKTAQSVPQKDLEASPDPTIGNAPPSAPNRHLQPSTAPVPLHPDTDDEERSRRVVQTIEDSDESDGSDFEWEDALLEHNTDKEDHVEGEGEQEIGDLSITIGGEDGELPEATRKIRRRAITSVDKKRRLDTHKMHVLCLLHHVHRRNAWCNDERVHAVLRKIPSPKALSNLVPNPDYSQYDASKRFVDGMQEMKMLWTSRFAVTAKGMHRPRWVDADAEVQTFAEFDELDPPMDRQDFRKAASTLEGSADVGAQLFCAMLRGIGVEARLVCSLQCLPFASAAQAASPQKPKSDKTAIYLDPYNKPSTPHLPKPKATTRPKRMSRLERVIGERSAAISTGAAPKRKKKYHTPYPVYWVEALNSAQQRWIAIDPHSTYTVDKADKLEPPLNSTDNSLAYAIAFEEDLSAKDVTRRYAKAYNAKTRKFRVESTQDGANWWNRALKLFRRRERFDRDQVEDRAMDRKEAAEGMPKNVQDFKDHPVYVLERHLRHNEVIHPMNQVGKVNVGSGMNPKMEPIYRRKDTHIVRSADKWYRLGRDVKEGENPLKHAKPRKGARRSIPPDIDVDDQQEEVGTALYAFFQTELYVPPPVIRGRVPRNTYGNLDIYVPSMIPMGGAHVPHKLAAKAARIVGIDYADAITGFSFKGRHGTAIVQGVIVAQEYKDAINAVIDGMEYAQEEAEDAQRSSEALRMWRRFLIGLRIAQRINAIEIEGERGPVDVQEEIEKEDKTLTEQQMAGGFFMDEGADAIEPLPPTIRRSRKIIEEDDDLEEGFDPGEHQGSGGFIPDDVEEGGGGFVPEVSTGFGSTLLSQQELRPRQNEDFSGGFVSDEDEEDNGGGFVREPLPTRLYHRSPVHETPDGFIQTHGAADDLDGGSVPYDEITEAVRKTATTKPAAAKPRGSDPSEDDDNATVQTSEPSHQEPVYASVAAQTISNVVTQDTGPQTEEAPLNSSPSDAGSLPLEDPDDEDADPDWLVDAT
jgi:xeroderma pigmentosum group C-complementing protein